VNSSRDKLEPLLRDALARHVPGFRSLTDFDRLSGGASQETYRLVVETESGERRLAMRRAAGGAWSSDGAGSLGRPGLTGEALLMQTARLAGVPEPEVLGIFEESDGLGNGFVMEWLDGETLGKRIVQSEELAGIRPKLARQCGEILARIHAIDVAGMPVASHLEIIEPRSFVEQSWDTYKSLETPQPMLDYTARWLIEHLPESPRSTLVHNDFRNGNLMIGPDGVRAVLDWEIAHIGDPMRDLGWICTNSWRFGNSALPVGGFGDYEELFAGYESVSGQSVDREHVKFWEVFGSFWWGMVCLSMVGIYRSGIDRSVERAAIGRRTSEGQVDCVNLLIPGRVDLIEPAERSSTLDMPSLDELTASVRDFLREDVMGATRGRVSFHARVAANSLDIVLRQHASGSEHRRREQAGLARLLDSDDEIEPLRWRLVEALRDGSMPLDEPGLADHLRSQVVNQLAIDQPRYSGFRTALADSRGD
jgi:aminoglycoside phosphotransferase (APT) family kinase protein